jgi:hypothetical protein
MTQIEERARPVTNRKPELITVFIFTPHTSVEDWMSGLDKAATSSAFTMSIFRLLLE